jgi:Flp pilus assembly CpaE family ATPase
MKYKKQEQKWERKKERKIINIVGAKGGIGTTTIA